MKFISLLIIFILSFSSFSQIDTLDHKTFQFEYDSVDLSLWDLYFKELSEPVFSEGVFLPETVRPDSLLAHVNLSEMESNNLLVQLRDSSSYDDTRALLYHYNLVIDFFHQGSVVNRIEISTMTGNITVDNKLNDSYYGNNVSLSFGKYIEELMNRYQLIELLLYDEVDLMGLRPITD